MPLAEALSGKIMRALIQRVKKCKVTVNDRVVAEIGMGLLIFLGIGPDDGEEQARYLADKITNLRIFEDQDGKMNRSLHDVAGKAMVVSQFTLYADTKKGRRPSFTNAASPDVARPLVDRFAELLNRRGVHTQKGEFGAHMLVDIANDGPVTIMIERE